MILVKLKVINWLIHINQPLFKIWTKIFCYGKKQYYSNNYGRRFDFRSERAQDLTNWSREIGGGSNSKWLPLCSAGIFSPTLNLGHIEFRCTFNVQWKFGLKLDYGFGSDEWGRLQADASTGSFNTSYSRLNLQVSLNIGRIRTLNSFTKSFGLLLHGGLELEKLILRKTRSNTFDDDVLLQLCSELHLNENWVKKHCLGLRYFDCP